ncbi:hypothetical protein CPB83DRAFT_861625 [Crepidotus variabilis]|uniref:Uncharacterized protein n=1 Tax=Crepidotus variabilis TaxID=179855 RepID=A0A9P6JKV6_9AGAR|nr:hypothetical protein CPB83DRAFT_861625 [Crepidotus variabilis]
MLDEDLTTPTVCPDRKTPIVLQDLTLCLPVEFYLDIKPLFKAKLANSQPVLDVNGLKALTVTKCQIAIDAIQYLVDIGANNVEEFRVTYYATPEGLSHGLKPLAHSLKRIYFTSAVSYLYELLPELSAMSHSDQRENIVEMIGIHLEFSFYENLDSSDWASLVALLVDKSAWPALRDIDITIDCRDIMDKEWETLDQVVKQFGPLASAGLLRYSIRRWAGAAMMETRRLDSISLYW